MNWSHRSGIAGEGGAGDYKGWVGTTDDPYQKVRHRTNRLGKRYAMLWKEGTSTNAYNIGSYSNPNFTAILLSNNVKPNAGHDWVWWVSNNADQYHSQNGEALLRRFYAERYPHRRINRVVDDAFNRKGIYYYVRPDLPDYKDSATFAYTAGDTWVDGFEISPLTPITNKATDQNVIGDNATASVKIMGNTYAARKTSDEAAWRAAWMRYIWNSNAKEHLIN